MFKYVISIELMSWMRTVVPITGRSLSCLESMVLLNDNDKRY